MIEFRTMDEGVATMVDEIAHLKDKTVHLKDRTVEAFHRVVCFEDLPEWMQSDPYIRHGYRKQLSSFNKCYESLFYLHNETVNIWSHLLVGLLFTSLLLATDYSILHDCPQLSASDTLAVQSYLAGATGCLFLSVSIFSVQIFPIGFYFSTLVNYV